MQLGKLLSEFIFRMPMGVLLYKEALRFLKVGMQTLLAPVTNTLLYLVVFSHVLEGKLSIYDGISYTLFFVPGLLIMSAMQNSFANASSSLIQSKVTGNLIFVLLSPISYFQFFAAYVAASVLRGMLVAIIGFLVTIPFIGFYFPHSPLILFGAMLLSCLFLACMGLIAGIVSEKFDQIAAFQNFLILPLSFLSGVFYSIKSLPIFWQKVSAFNPIFYAIDGVRYGFLGVSDAPPWLSLAVLGIGVLISAFIGLYLLWSGYKLRS